MSESEESKPLLVYDGDCGFCIYSVRYWQKLTGTRVVYKPYQEVSGDYPQISIPEFQSAVQYITPDGKVARAAEASFLTLNHAKNRQFLLSLYRKLPGFAFFTEQSYKLVSSHRSFFYRASLLLWGRDPEPPTYDLLAWIFLRLFAVVFFIAFYSFGSQALGLIGSQGIVPVVDLIDAARTQIGSMGYWYLPMVFWLNSSDLAIQTVCWSGMLLSVMLMFNLLPRICLLGMYALYLSLIYGGQVFMTFQWDMLLLETAIIAFFLIRFQTLGVWLLRWLVFRFIFCAAIVKLASGDPSWWNYTALDYHFLTQPLPTPLAWYAYYFPSFLLKTLTVASIVIELIIPFLIFFPRRLRFLAGFSILAMQTGIMLTGNYNFFNITSIVLCISLFDDAALRAFIPRRLAPHMRQPLLKNAPFKVMTIIAVIFTVASIFLSFVQFNLRFIGMAPEFSVMINNTVAPLQMVSTYGPFAVMTKKRYEIIIEGSNDGSNWSEYSFKYKPGDIFRKPLWNIPFQPRLDWQMWFAALGSQETNPWFGRFLSKLLVNSPDVIALLERNPFPDLPPVFVRALFFDYTYTTKAEYQATGAWWNRMLVGVYYPAASLS